MPSPNRGDSPGHTSPAKPDKATGQDRDKISVRETSIAEKPVRKPFPGPPGAKERLRIAMDRAAYAELIAHAKESLDAEVCGVLAGHVGEDDEGLYLHLEAVIRGAGAAQGSTHVTFTQATWNTIHQTLERDHPQRRMLGWYHTHPGFGVEFSEMDLFIQKNFFGGPTQIALVTDPLTGAVAIGINQDGGVHYLSRFWVDGREQICRKPEGETKGGSLGVGAGTSVSGAETDRTLQGIDARLGQLIQAMDDQRNSYYRFLVIVGLVVCLGVLTVIAFFIWNQTTSRIKPPDLVDFVPVPVQVGDKSVLIGVGVVKWDVPPELNSVYLQLEQMKREAAAEAASKASQTNKSRPAPAGGKPTQPTPPPEPAKGSK